MSRVNGTVLRQLRELREWSRADLAEKTKLGNQPKIDKQTIYRLEKGVGGKTRIRTIQQLASALGVEPAVLTGEAPIPEGYRESCSPEPRSQFNIRIGAGPRNALMLVAHRYGVARSQIVELAPLLFVWAAEESLRQRREKIEELGCIYDAALKIEREMPHMPMTDFTQIDEKLVEEKESINPRGLFGGSRSDSKNPFAMYLRRLTDSLGEVAEFQEWSGSWTPRYRVCIEEAVELAGGDRDRADGILDGRIDLNKADESRESNQQIDIMKLPLRPKKETENDDV